MPWLSPALYVLVEAIVLYCIVIVIESCLQGNLLFLVDFGVKWNFKEAVVFQISKTKFQFWYGWNVEKAC